MALLSWIEAGSLVTALIVLMLILVLRRCLVVVTIEGQSMVPALKPSDRVLVLRFWPAKWLRKGQIVLISPMRRASQEPARSPLTPYIKRIIAVSGEMLELSAEESVSAVSPLFAEACSEPEPHTWRIPQGHVFVCGDNRAHSIDSRAWGALPTRCVLGAVCLKLPHKAQLLSFPSPQPVLTLQGSSSEQPAPAFSAPAISGEIVTLDAYQGQALLLLFLADTRVSRPLILSWQTLALSLVTQGIATVFVCDGDEEQTRALVERYALVQPVVIAPRERHPFLNDYHVQGTPAYCLIDAQGNIQSSGFPNHSSPGWRALTVSRQT